MGKREQKLRFTFINPNDRRMFERQLSRILIDKLLAVHRRHTAAI